MYLLDNIDIKVGGYFRGYKTIFINNEWFYEDTMEKSGFSGVVRPCKKCGKVFEGSNIGDPDPCLGTLPGVKNACCGHGVRSQSYICFENGVIIRDFKIEQALEEKE